MTRFHPREWHRPRQWAAVLWRDHRLIMIAVTLSLVPRILALLAFRPALFTPDSFAYLAEGGTRTCRSGTRPATRRSSGCCRRSTP